MSLTNLAILVYLIFLVVACAAAIAEVLTADKEKD